MLREKYENELEITFTGSIDEAFNFLYEYKLKYWETIAAYAFMPVSSDEKMYRATIYRKKDLEKEEK